MKKITFENLDFDENDFDWMEEEPNTNPKVGDTVKVLDNGLLDYINKYDWSGMGRIIGNTYKVKEIGTLYKTDEESVIIYDTGAPPFGRWTVPFKFVKVVSVNESINFDEDDWDYMEDDPTEYSKKLTQKQIRQLKIGDRVMCDNPGQIRMNDVRGTVVEQYDDWNQRIGVEFDMIIPRGHADCGKNGHCWNIPFGYLEII